MKIYSLFFGLWLLGVGVHAQSSPKIPKIGLVLSGGGAKGLAHMGILQVLDSLDIRVDYITGTSMGGILGSLYAMGIPADTIKKIGLTLNWDEILSNKVPLWLINFEEKDEYDNYFIELPIINKKPSLPSSLIDGQYMSEIFNDLTYNARHITNFQKLPIPLELTGSDILQGGLVLLKSGSLPLAIRSTMAIPAAFSPVHYQGKLLVDGGLDRNFPVREVLDMGAEKVIGSYTGFRLFTEKEIVNPFKMIYQTQAFSAIHDAKEQQSQTDILIDNTEAIYPFSTADFKKYKQIIAAGELAVKSKLPELIELSKQQHQAGIHKIVKPITDPKIPFSNFKFLTDDEKEITDVKISRFIEHKLGLKRGEVYSSIQVKKAIRRLFGTRFFDKVYYTVSNDNEKLTMNIRVKNSQKSYFKISPHFSTEQGAGLIINYTLRDWLMPQSRLIFTLDIAEHLRVRANWYTFLTPNAKFWIRPRIEIITNKSYSFYNSIYQTNEGVSRFFNRDIFLGLGLGYSFSRNTAFLAEFRREFFSYNRAIESDLELISDGAPSRKVLDFRENNALILSYMRNTLNKSYFSTRGSQTLIEGKYFFTTNLSETDPQTGEDLTRSIPSLYRLIIRHYQNTPLSPKISLQTMIKGHLLFGANLTTSRFITQSLSSFLGGISVRTLVQEESFMGLRASSLAFLRNTVQGRISLQYNPFRSIFIKPILDVAAFDDDNQLVYGYGFIFGVNSFLPINLSISKVNGHFLNDLGVRQNWRISFSIGYEF